MDADIAVDAGASGAFHPSALEAFFRQRREYLLQ